jgi:hypothetical protein
MSNMPRRKYLILLYLLEDFINKKMLNKGEVLCQFDISEISFKRYLGCLKEYLYYAHPTWRIVYRRSKQVYELCQKEEFPH